MDACGVGKGQGTAGRVTSLSGVKLVSLLNQVTSLVRFPNPEPVP